MQEQQRGVGTQSQGSLLTPPPYVATSQVSWGKPGPRGPRGTICLESSEQRPLGSGSVFRVLFHSTLRLCGQRRAHGWPSRASVPAGWRLLRDLGGGRCRREDAADGGACEAAHEVSLAPEPPRRMYLGRWLPPGNRAARRCRVGDGGTVRWGARGEGAHLTEGLCGLLDPVAGMRLCPCEQTNVPPYKSAGCCSQPACGPHRRCAHLVFAEVTKVRNPRGGHPGLGWTYIL